MPISYGCFFSEASTTSFVHFFNWVVSLVLVCKRSLCILDTSPLSHIYGVHHLLLFCSLLHICFVVTVGGVSRTVPAPCPPTRPSESVLGGTVQRGAVCAEPGLNGDQRSLL